MFALFAATGVASTGNQGFEFVRALDLASSVGAELPARAYRRWTGGRVRTETRIGFTDQRGADERGAGDGEGEAQLRVARTYSSASTRTSFSDFEPEWLGPYELVSESEHSGRTLHFGQGLLGWRAERCEPAFVALQPLAEVQLCAFESADGGAADDAGLCQALMLPAGTIRALPWARDWDEAEPTGRLAMLEMAVELCFSVGSFVGELEGELERTGTTTGRHLRGRLRKSVDLRPAFARALGALEPGARRPFPGELGLHADLVADVRGRLVCDENGLPLASECSGDVRIELRAKEVVFDWAGGRHEIECVYELTGTLEQRLGPPQSPERP